MKYFNIKRYKFSTIIGSVSGLLNNISKLGKIINFKKILNYFDDIRYSLKKASRYLDIRNYKIIYINIIKNSINIIKNSINIIKNFKNKSNKFLFFHLPTAIIFFAFLYLMIPTFYKYDKLVIQKTICESSKITCVVRGKINYSFIPTPRFKIKDLIINISSNGQNLLTVKETSLILSIKNLLAKEKHKAKKIVFNDFESKINLKKLKKYNKIFENKISSLPMIFTKGKILLYEGVNYIAAINDVKLVAKLLKDSSEAKLKGKFLDDNIIINFNNKIHDNLPKKEIEFRMKGLNFYTKLSFFDSKKVIKNGKFLIKKDNNKISGLFDYKDNQISILNSNIRNSYIDGKILGNIILLPFFDFNLDLNLNSINFTKIYNYFLSLDKEDQKKVFKINNKINGKLNFSAEKVYSKPNLVRSFESRIKFYNGNTKIEQFLINLGKLGAADLVGKIDNDKDSVNFKFESNVFVDNKKKFLSKFGIYNKEKISSNIFIQGNFDIENIKLSFYEISDEEKFNTEDVNFIETEFNDLMLENDFEDLFNFQKFKVFLKSAREENN